MSEPYVELYVLHNELIKDHCWTRNELLVCRLGSFLVHCYISQITSFTNYKHRCFHHRLIIKFTGKKVKICFFVLLDCLK